MSQILNVCFRICAVHSIDNMGALLLSSAQSQELFCFSHCPTSKEAGGAQGGVTGHSWDS